MKGESIMKHFSSTFRLAIVLGLGLSFAGCVTAVTSVDARRAEPRWKFIGRAESGCPSIYGWKPRPMFPGTQSPDLARHCVYEARSAFSQNPVGRLKRQQVAAASDAVALAPSGLEDTVQPHFSTYFFQQVGRPASLPIDPAPPRVRLAFLDSHPTGEGIAALPDGCTPGHGDFLRLLGHALTCEGNLCMTRITTRLALPIRTFDADSQTGTATDVECGGYIGSFESLASAII